MENPGRKAGEHIKENMEKLLDDMMYEHSRSLREQKIDFDSKGAPCI